MPKIRSKLELLMDSQLRGADITEWRTEYQFFTGRNWRFDFAWPDVRVALEIEGGSWSDGRHTRGKGFEKDIEKYNMTLILGWKVVRATAHHVESGIALVWIETLLRRPA